MTEIERMLKNTLIRMEQEFSAKLASQDKALEEQQRVLEVHSQGLKQLREKNSQANTDLQSLTQRLENLAGLYRNLEPLLSRLNGLLSGK